MKKSKFNEEQNRRLKRMVADLSFDITLLLVLLKMMWVIFISLMKKNVVKSRSDHFIL